MPDPATFLRRLWAKAGLRPGLWPRGMEVWRFGTVEHRRTVTDVRRAA